MNSFQDLIFRNEVGTGAIAIETVLMSLLLSFCLGHIVAWVYMWTHSGLSYSQTFTASLVVVSVLVSMVMVMMAGNLFIAFGLMAVFAIVRFRNVLKDTRDTTFILWAIIQGMAVGTQKYGVAIIGCLLIALMILYLRVTTFGARQRFDVVLSLHLAGDAARGDAAAAAAQAAQLADSTGQPADPDRGHDGPIVPAAAAQSGPQRRVAGRVGSDGRRGARVAVSSGR